VTNLDIKRRLGVLEAGVQEITFRAHLHKARRAEDFTEGLFDAARVAQDTYALDKDLDGLDADELLEIAGGEEFARWFLALDDDAQLRFAQGELSPWRETP